MAGTTYQAHELKTRFKCTGLTKVVVSWKEADISDNPLYHAASHIGWQAKGGLGRYVRRWSVERSYRDAKQHLGLGRCQMQSMEGTRIHWYLILPMFTLLKQQGCHAGTREVFGKDGAITLGDCRWALRTRFSTTS